MPNRKWAKAVERQISEPGTCVTPKCVKRCQYPSHKKKCKLS